MVFDSKEHRAGGREATSPMRIAQHPLFTAKEKIDLLQELKAEVAGAMAGDGDVGFSAAEIDAAIQQVKLGVQNGEGTETVLRGDY